MTADNNVLEAIKSTHEQRVSEINERYKRSQGRMTAVFVLFLFGLIALDWFASLLPNPPGASVVEISNLRAVGPTELCPGEILRYAYDISGDRSGVLDLDTTIWRVTPPAAVLYSMSRRVVLVEPINFEREDAWLVPVEGTDPLTLQRLQWLPGAYERRIAISTPSRNTQPAIAVLPFSIREDCNL